MEPVQSVAVRWPDGDGLVSGPLAARLGDGRLHFQHGPIDLVIAMDGPTAEVEAASRQAWACFGDVLPGLVAELPLLRRPVPEMRAVPRDPVARRMVSAVSPHNDTFVTPMAAVAGAVADAVLAAATDGRELRRAYVNNGGDIAFHLAPGESYATGIVGDVDMPRIDALAELRADMPVRGLATSGWRGRSHSLGIADAVTVLAGSAAVADVAATLIANAVDTDHPAVERRPASELDPDSDLGGRLVTVGVGDLPDVAVHDAVDAGRRCAEDMLRGGLIDAALLQLAGVQAVVGGAEVTRKLAFKEAVS
jgi:ApbE superfamily uncharacterized protein (UPF0280 family)